MPIEWHIIKFKIVRRNVINIPDTSCQKSNWNQIRDFSRDENRTKPIDKRRQDVVDDILRWWLSIVDKILWSTTVITDTNLSCLFLSTSFAAMSFRRIGRYTTRSLIGEKKGRLDFAQFNRQFFSVMKLKSLWVYFVCHMYATHHKNIGLMHQCQVFHNSAM